MPFYGENLKQSMQQYEAAPTDQGGSRTSEHASSVFAPGAHQEVWRQVPGEFQRAAANFTDQIVEEAKKGKTPEARRRIEKAALEIVQPGIGEAITIGAQVADTEYIGDATGKVGFVPEMLDYLNLDIRARTCADLRGAMLAYGGFPKIQNMTRSAGADLDAVVAENGQGYRVRDIDQRANIATSIRQRKTRNPNNPARFIFITGPHFDSAEPTTHSCAANQKEIEGIGGLASIDMQQGGISHWFERTGEEFFAKDNEIRIQGGDSTTFDVSLDTHNQRIIAGLRQNYKYFDPARSLSENIGLLAKHGRILTSDTILELFGDEIKLQAQSLGVQDPIDIFDYTKYGQNLRTIGRVAKAITQQAETNGGFDWIPPDLFFDQATGTRINDEAMRAFAFTMIGNAVYRSLTGVGEGEKNPLKHHPETMLRVGPIGADFNVRTVALVQGTHTGEIQPADIARAVTLSNVLRSNLDNLGYGSEQTARVIRVTGVIDPRGKDPEAIASELDTAKATIQRNIEILAPHFKQGENTGSVLLFGTVHERTTRTPVAVVTR